MTQRTDTVQQHGQFQHDHLEAGWQLAFGDYVKTAWMQADMQVRDDGGRWGRGGRGNGGVQVGSKGWWRAVVKTKGERGEGGGGTKRKRKDSSIRCPDGYIE